MAVRARFVGNRPGTQIRWQANRHLWFQADYGIFYAGRFLKESQPGRNLNYWALWADYELGWFGGYKGASLLIAPSPWVRPTGLASTILRR
jgi:hypothetical protein